MVLGCVSHGWRIVSRPWLVLEPENLQIMMARLKKSVQLRLRMILGLGVAFVLACCKPPAEKARLALLEQGITADSEAVVAAAASGRTDVLELLQTSGVNLVKPPHGKATLPLVTAIKKKSAAVPMLLKATPSELINAPDEAGRTALSHAMTEGNDELVLSILKKSADPTATKHPAGSVLDDAIKSNRPLVVRALIERLPSGAALLQSGLITAVHEADADAVAQLLEHGAPSIAADEAGLTVLEKAAAAGDLAIVELLVKAGAKWDAATAKAENPLGHAAQRNNLEMARLLIKAGCSPDVPLKSGGTPTGLAASQKHLPMLTLFLDHQADPQPHFQSALVAKDVEVLELLLEKGASINQLDTQGNSPLIQTVLRNDAAMLKWLLEHKADQGLVGKAGQTAFAIAQAMHFLPLMQIFLDAGADPNEPFKSPVSQDFLAMIDNDYFKTWLQKDQNLSPMMLAASRGDIEALRMLMKSGGKRGNQTKGWKRYPVNFACENSHIPAAQLLLGQDPDSKRDVRVVVSLSKQRAWIYKGSEVVRSTEISTGKSGFATPSGKYVISDKQADWKSSIYKVAMPFFMRLSCKDFGLHAGVVTGRPASHGCVRLPKAEAAAFFSVMQIGDPVTILN